jgi:nucleotide-binding universal stress UspA family protein
MPIRTILAAASGGAATAGAIELACQLARRFEAHLEALHVRPDASAIYAASGENIGGPASATLVETIMQEAAAKAAETRTLFDQIVGRHGIARHSMPQLPGRHPSAGWREEAGAAATVVARHGRFFDLVVLGCSDRVAHEPYSDTIEATLVGSGRPVLLAPTAPPSGIGYVVAIAWNGSPQAVRALTASLPFLEKASAVSLITAGEVEAGGARLAVDYLAWHGIAAEPRTVPGGPARQIGSRLMTAAKDAGADLLVMGAYGHPPWREHLFGGATRTLLATSPLPLLLMH